MPVNWQDPEVKDRLLAAIIASMGGSVNCKEVARVYGPDATYNAIENFLRKPKAKAKELTAEATRRSGGGGGSGSASPAKTSPAKAGSAKTSPVKKDGVKSGRVGKGSLKKGGGLKKNAIEKIGEEEVKGVVKKEVFDGDEEADGEV